MTSPDIHSGRTFLHTPVSLYFDEARVNQGLPLEIRKKRKYIRSITMKAKVITDSGSGLTQKQADALGIGYLPLQVLIDETQYLDGVDMDTQKLYEFLDEGKMPTTSQPPLLLEEELFESLKNEGVTDLIVISLSNGLSSTNQIVQATAGRLGLNVHTLDIYTTLAVQQYLVIAAKQLLDAGKSPEEIIEILKAAVDESAGYLMVDNLDHLAAGGRLTPLAAKLGGMLKIKPVLRVSKETAGKVDTFDKVRTFHKAVARGVEQVKAGMKEGVEYELFVLNGNAGESALAAQEAMQALQPGSPVHMLDMFAVIACHTGLGSVGVQYIPKIEGVTYDETRICD